MSILHSGPSGFTDAQDVWDNYTGANAEFYIDGIDEQITSIQPCQDGSDGFELTTANGQTIFVPTDEPMWLVNPDRGDDAQ